MNSVPIEQFDVARGTGKAFAADKGRLVRLVQIERGGQVVDLTVFNRHNPDERLWGPETAREYGTNLTVGAPLVSTGPWEEPLLTVVGDKLPREPCPKGTRYHDVVLTCCARKSHFRRYGPQKSAPGCFEAISEAVSPFGIPSRYVDHMFNVFRRTGFANGSPFHEPSEVGPGVYVERRAEKDVIVAESTCQGRSSQPYNRGSRIEIR